MPAEIARKSFSVLKIGHLYSVLSGDPPISLTQVQVVRLPES